MPHPDEPPVYLNDEGQVCTPEGARLIWHPKGKPEMFIEDMDRRHIINAMNSMRNNAHPQALMWLANLRHVYYIKTAEKREAERVDSED